MMASPQLDPARTFRCAIQQSRPLDSRNAQTALAVSISLLEKLMKTCGRDIVDPVLTELSLESADVGRLCICLQYSRSIYFISVSISTASRNPALATCFSTTAAWELT